MGIKGLTSLIKLYSPDSMVTYNYNFYTKSIIAIDTSILLYKFRYLSEENSKSHLKGFLKKCLKYVTHGIIPIFVMDGMPPVQKNDIITKRKNQKTRLIEKIKKLEEEIKSGNSFLQKELDKLNKQMIYITNEHKYECEFLLKSLGFLVIYSKGEAETMCAKLQKENKVNFTFTDDTDALALGCKKVLRSNSSNTFIQIDLDHLLEDLKLSESEFIDLCILCGCDYCPQIPKLNYKNALRLIKNYKNIENVIENIKNDYDIPKKYPYKEARSIFQNSRNLENNIKTIEKKINLNEKMLYNFLLEHGFRKEYIKNYIKKFKNKIKYCNEINNQKKISCYN